jgi:hypothetical protein
VETETKQEQIGLRLPSSLAQKIALTFPDARRHDGTPNLSEAARRLIMEGLDAREGPPRPRAPRLPPDYSARDAITVLHYLRRQTVSHLEDVSEQYPVGMVAEALTFVEHLHRWTERCAERHNTTVDAIMLGVEIDDGRDGES